jgi:hypothetical protein
VRKKINPEDMPEAAAFLESAKADIAIETVKETETPEIVPAPVKEKVRKVVARADSQSVEKNEDLHQYVHRAAWPIFTFPSPSLVPDSSQRKTQNIMTRVTDGMFESVARHCHALDVDKSEWLRNAIERQLAEEQQYFKLHTSK